MAAAQTSFTARGTPATPLLRQPVLMRLPSARTEQELPANVPTAASQRSAALEQSAREADGHTRRGFELADRGAFYSAREEFVVALRILSQALDTEYHTRKHAQALADGLRALEEADDFLPKGSRLEADLRLKNIIAGHQTPVLKPADLDRLTPMTAMREYLTFAQTRLAEAVGSEFAGSMALYAMGKLHRIMGRELPGSVVAADSKALAVLQSALLARPNNAIAANELGTLLATAGRLEDARRALEHSVRSWPTATAWRNLAVVYERLGDPRAASRSAAEAQTLAAADPGEMQVRTPSGTVQIEWVDPQDFQKTQSVDAVYDRAHPPAQDSAPVAKTAAGPQRSTPKKSGFLKF